MGIRISRRRDRDCSWSPRQQGVWEWDFISVRRPDDASCLPACDKMPAKNSETCCDTCCLSYVLFTLSLNKKCEIKNPAVIWGKGQPATSSCPFSAFLVNPSHATRMFLIPSSPLLSLTADFLSGGVSLTQ